MKNRIIGFNLARAYAIFGMFIVNFNTVFGNHTNHNGVSGYDIACILPKFINKQILKI